MDTENVVVTKQDRKYKTLVTDIGKEKMTNARPMFSPPHFLYFCAFMGYYHKNIREYGKVK